MTSFEQGHALVVGVGADLPNTVDDAAGLAAILQDPTRCAYAPAQVRTLTGEFYYLLPYNYDLDRLYQTGISGVEFTDRLRAIPAQKLLVLLDCCHAGGIGEAKAPGLQLAKSPLPPEAQNLLAEGSGRVLIASSQEDELSFAGRPYSAFTLALIEALCGAGVAKRDGYVRVADLALHAREVVPGRTGGRQHPILHFEQADNFVLAYYAGGETQAKAAPFAATPVIEPEPGAWSGVIDQRGQIVHGSQVNVAGDVHKSEVVGNFGNQQVTVGGTLTQIGKMEGGQVVSGTGQATEAAAVVCSACGHRRVRPTARFCGQCGAPLGPR